MWMTLLVATGGGVLGAVLVLAFKAIRKRRIRKDRESIAPIIASYIVNEFSWFVLNQAEIMRTIETCDCDECRAARAAMAEREGDPLEDMGYRRQGDI